MAQKIDSICLPSLEMGSSDCPALGSVSVDPASPVPGVTSHKSPETFKASVEEISEGVA